MSSSESTVPATNAGTEIRKVSSVTESDAKSVQVVYNKESHRHRYKLTRHQFNWESPADPRYKTFVDTHNRGTGWKQWLPDPLTDFLARLQKYESPEVQDKWFGSHVLTWPRDFQRELFAYMDRFCSSPS
jgi:hypothetical protein